jgi:hypothetical protein
MTRKGKRGGGISVGRAADELVSAWRWVGPPPWWGGGVQGRVEDPKIATCKGLPLQPIALIATTRRTTL